MITPHILKSAFETRDLEEFLFLIFPKSWQGIRARIIETGAEFTDHPYFWAPRWSPISPTVKSGTDLEKWVKSCLYRAHDSLHQLWGLPIPQTFSEEEFYSYKRAQMCGEVAVLTITEFSLAKYFYDHGNSEIQEIIKRRNAIPMIEGPLEGKTLRQLAVRLDGLLHKIVRPKWVRENQYASAFVEDYVPMLQGDRAEIDRNWNLMKSLNWTPKGAPFTRYSQNLDGLELTTWMIEDFEHLMGTDGLIDWELTRFNRNRRSKIIFPDQWGTNDD